MSKKNVERIALLVQPWFKQRIKEKACSQKKTITQIVTTLLEKWLKEKK